MSDTKTGDENTLTVNTKKTLTLKRPGLEQGTVRQNFSHGRTKSVVVETRERVKCCRPAIGGRSALRGTPSAPAVVEP